MKTEYSRSFAICAIASLVLALVFFAMGKITPLVFWFIAGIVAFAAFRKKIFDFL